MAEFLLHGNSQNRPAFAGFSIAEQVKLIIPHARGLAELIGLLEFQVVLRGLRT